MEMTINSLSYTKPKSLSSAFFPTKSNLYPNTSLRFGGCICPSRNLICTAGYPKHFGAINASDSEINSIDTSVRWLLEPIGDGDSRHIGYKIVRPDAFEIASSEVTVGRSSEKADIVISVPTVSGVHARIQKTHENLLITDLDSTNGTFINEKRLSSGVVSIALPGSFITFGDTNLAKFKVSKLKEEEFTAEAIESETMSG